MANNNGDISNEMTEEIPEIELIIKLPYDQKEFCRTFTLRTSGDSLLGVIHLEEWRVGIGFNGFDYLMLVIRIYEESSSMDESIQSMIWFGLVTSSFLSPLNHIRASTIDGRRKGACLFCQEYFMDLYLLAELKTISLKSSSMDESIQSMIWFGLVTSSFLSPLNHIRVSSFYDPLEQIWVVADRVQHLISNVHAMLFLVAIEQFWYEFRGDRLMPKSLIKIEWHEPINMFRSSATSLTCSGVRHDLRRSHLLGLLRTFCTTDKRCFGPSPIPPQWLSGGRCYRTHIPFAQFPAPSRQNSSKRALHRGDIVVSKDLPRYDYC
ncbi:exc-4 [Cordylochernes scorpioides]|uniref:Exc-4 n=1 Tax=Cordylochernes scorpioides TaxID=51811 RepID=A0ABY6LPT9_9ARAC|nr:exc-4 [Cordylochernes scorpioides]